MKTYTFDFNCVKEGVSVEDDTNLGPVVRLGEMGRGRRMEKVGLFRKNPAEIIDGRVLEAHPVLITIKKGTDQERTFCTLAKPYNHSAKILVRISTEGTYTRHTSGRWEGVVGRPEKLVEGWGAYGDAGRLGKWSDSLATMMPGDVIKITLSGGYKISPRALWYDTKEGLRVMNWEDYENLQALSGG